ncbi:MAG: branched-chain amino acid ABC transporter permease [Alphaproteobacteria bacterium]|nr:branched-chain amino acid ABC transporter permease [Alphaproteobacteria bacterium]
MERLATLSPRGWVMIIGLLLLALLPPLVAVTGHTFYLDLASRLMILGIAAVSLNLILGHGGMISFGHAAYLGIGAYSVGIPAYYEIHDGFIQIPLAVATSAVFALITGAICLRTKGVYFIMITMAFTQMVFYAFVSIEEYGGDDGLVIDLRSEFAGLINIDGANGLYYFIFVSLLAVLFLVHRITRSRFGMVIEGARGNERRMRAIGYDTYRYRLVCYVIAGAICGYAGALLGNFTNFISPEMMDWTASGELIFMVVLGGTGSLFGPILGAAAFVLLEEWLSAITIYWQFIFGTLLILVVLFWRGGLNGLVDWIGRATWRKRS